MVLRIKSDTYGSSNTNIEITFFKVMGISTGRPQKYDLIWINSPHKLQIVFMLLNNPFPSF